MRDLAAELKDFDGEWPPCWRPKEGETLVGRILRYSQGQTMYGPCHTVILHKDDGSRVSVWLSSTVLLSQFREQKPKVGERVGIRYLGKHPDKGYKRFALLVDRGEAQETDFSPLGGESDPEGSGDGPFDWGDSPARYAAATVR
jgi:hypothetical protein